MFSSIAVQTRWLALAVVTVLSGAAQASVVERLPLSELARRSDAIVVGQVLSTETRWSDDHHHLFRRVTVQVEERWKGQGPEEIVLLLRGGELDGIQEQVLGVPFFDDGLRAVFFLRRHGDVHSLVGLGQGALELSLDESGKQWGAQRLENLSLAGPGVQGQMQISEHGEGGLGPVRLEDLRAAVKALTVDSVDPKVQR